MKTAGGDITNAIETLELLTDLGTELRVQTQSLAGMRQALTEIAMLETTIGRAMRVLEPLAQLKNLTRMNEAEVLLRHERFSNNATRRFLATTNCNPRRQPPSCLSKMVCFPTSHPRSTVTAWFRCRVISGRATNQFHPSAPA